MNLKIQNYFRQIILFFLILSPVVSFADDFDDGPEPPPAPIGDYIFLLMGVGVVIVFFLFYQREKKNQIKRKYTNS
jgi:pilus assembly protein TadC